MKNKSCPVCDSRTLRLTGHDGLRIRHCTSCRWAEIVTSGHWIAIRDASIFIAILLGIGIAIRYII